MRIQISPVNVPEEADKAQRKPAVDGAPDAAAAVVVSPRAAQLHSTAERSRAAHAERLAALKVEISSGSYRVDRQKLADRIVDDELERGRR